MIRLHDASISKSTPSHLTPYQSRYASQSFIPKAKIPDEGAPADSVYQMIKDELDLDGRPNLNLARQVRLAPLPGSRLSRR